jgi:NAD(P)-dependent dehydrogenase (short-subunit alcohol dehydrogenase family)
MLREHKNTVIYGGGGKVGGAVAHAFAREGANIFLAGRTPERLEEVAAQIRAAGGVAETSRVDALDERTIEEHVGEMVERVGGVDISFNAISIRDVQLIPLAEMSREDFMSPIVTGTASHFLTARAAARRMAERGSGVILTLSASAVCAYVPGRLRGRLRDRLRGDRSPHETTRGGAQAERDPRELPAAGGDPGELGGRFDRRLVGSAGRDRGADEGPFLA